MGDANPNDIRNNTLPLETAEQDEKRRKVPIYVCVYRKVTIIPSVNLRICAVSQLVKTFPEYHRNIAEPIKMFSKRRSLAPSSRVLHKLPDTYCFPSFSKTYITKF